MRCMTWVGSIGGICKCSVDSVVIVYQVRRLMLTRLQVRGFKNLRNVDVAFGPFTCVAGPNASGKSNLFDVLSLLRDLAEFPIDVAIARVRDPEQGRSDARALFYRSKTSSSSTFRIAAEFIVPEVVQDDLGRATRPSATYLRYEVELEFVQGGGAGDERVELVHESLDYALKGGAKKRLGFRYSKDFGGVIKQNRTKPYISTVIEDRQPVIKLHQDGGTGGRPAFTVHARNSKRTVVGATTTNSEPTVLAARKEMLSWNILQLESSSLRRPDEFSATSRLTTSGLHLPATIHRLGSTEPIVSDLATFLPEVRDVRIDSDSGRRLRTLMVVGSDGVEHAARSLSDGTLRFLALASIRNDPAAVGVICLEEPENGIHPSRVPAMLRLLQAMAVSTDEAVGNDNPLRQVLINTHSPLVVKSLPWDSIVFSRALKSGEGSETIFFCLAGSWRALGSSWKEGVGESNGMPTSGLTELLPYLDQEDSGLTSASPEESDRTVLKFAEQMKLELPLD
jgi:predicted ATPase